MSYLLTEISLEMLGYKYYDTDGNAGPIDFKHVGFFEPDPESPNIRSYLKQTDEVSSSSQVANNNVEDAQPGECNLAQNAKAQSDVNVNEKSTKEADTMNPTNVTNKPIDPLPIKYSPTYADKVLYFSAEKNYERICKILRNKTRLGQMITGKIKQKKGSLPDLLETFIETESKDLEKELERMKEFRKFLSNRLNELDSHIFQKNDQFLMDHKETLQEFLRLRTEND